MGETIEIVLSWIVGGFILWAGFILIYITVAWIIHWTDRITDRFHPPGW